MEWTRGPVIGRGSTATVSVATSVSTGQIFAAKSAELTHSMFLQKEQYFLSKLSSPYIVKYLGFDVTTETETKPMYNVFLEYATGGTIHDVIRSHGGKLDESMVRLYTRSILRGLDYLHDNGFVHCDIKSQNVLVNHDGEVKIADFGCAKNIKEGKNGNSAFSGTPVFMAPEVARGEEQEFAADVWAVGCTVIEMASGNQPWKAELENPVSALFRIGFSDEVPEIPSWLSETAKDFLKKCLMRDPKERWTVKELLGHEFIDGFDQSSVEVREFNMNCSPSCVLDQGFWDSMDGVETPQNLTYEHRGFLNSPTDRIKNLVGSVSDVPNWSYEEDWITVRSIDVEETKNGLEQNVNSVNEDLVVTEFFGVDSITNYQQEIESSNFEEDLMLSFYFGISSSVSTSLGNNFVSKCLTFEKDNDNSFTPFESNFHSSVLFIAQFLCLLFLACIFIFSINLSDIQLKIMTILLPLSNPISILLFCLLLDSLNYPIFIYNIPLIWIGAT